MANAIITGGNSVTGSTRAYGSLSLSLDLGEALIRVQVPSAAAGAQLTLVRLADGASLALPVDASGSELATFAPAEVRWAATDDGTTRTLAIRVADPAGLTEPWQVRLTQLDGGAASVTPQANATASAFEADPLVELAAAAQVVAERGAASLAATVRRNRVPAPVANCTQVVAAWSQVAGDAAAVPPGPTAMTPTTVPTPNGPVTACEARASFALPAAHAEAVLRYRLAATIGDFAHAEVATVTVRPVADTPTVTDAATDQDTQTVSGLVITPNPADGPEVTHFKITNIVGGALFQADGATPIGEGQFVTAAQGAAGLRFTPAPFSTDPGRFDVQASLSATDAGLGGATARATITVRPRADTPSVTDATTDQDTQSTSGLVISRNPHNGPEVTHFKVTNIVGGALFQADGATSIGAGQFITAAQGAAGLRFTPALFSSEPGHFDVQASLSATDAGLGGSTARATITVRPRADTPSVTNAVTNEDTQSTSGLVISRNVHDGPEVTHFKITNIVGGALFQADGATPIGEGQFVTAAQGAAGLRFSPASNFNGLGRFNVQASTSASDPGLGGGTVAAFITVLPIADTPSVTDATNESDGWTRDGLVISRNAADGPEVTHFKISSITAGSLFKHDAATPIGDGSFITAGEGGAGLRFRKSAPAAIGHFNVQASTAPNDSGLGGGLATATIFPGG